MLAISLLTEVDRAEWEVLTRRYNGRFGTEVSDDGYERTWQRLVALEEIRGIAARLDGRIVGIAHYLFHTDVWRVSGCYMEDLFVAPGARRQGIATAMLKWVARDAEEHGVPYVHCSAELDNAEARALCDKVANFDGFIVHTYPMRP